MLHKFYAFHKYLCFPIVAIGYRPQDLQNFYFPVNYLSSTSSPPQGNVRLLIFLILLIMWDARNRAISLALCSHLRPAQPSPPHLIQDFTSVFLSLPKTTLFSLPHWTIPNGKQTYLTTNYLNPCPSHMPPTPASSIFHLPTTSIPLQSLDYTYYLHCPALISSSILFRWASFS